MHIDDTRSRAQESRAAIQRLYIAMRHLFIRGNYKPLGLSGEAMINSLKQLSPEIYGSINDMERVELDGLLYIFQRLPHGIEECRYIRLISREGFEDSHFEAIIPPKRRRNSYRIDHEQMFIEMTRGRSDIYDILTHLTFMYIEAEKIRRNSQDAKGRMRREWLQLEDIVQREAAGKGFNQEVAYTYLSTLLGRTFEDTVKACSRFSDTPHVNSIFHITYWLGCRSIEEARDGRDREITFSSALREKIGHHIYGERWARSIKRYLATQGWLDRPLHIISANQHSVMNSLYAEAALSTSLPDHRLSQLAQLLSDTSSQDQRETVESYALAHGMHLLEDTSGANIPVQLYDTSNIVADQLPGELAGWIPCEEKAPIILVMDYAFGEQAYETMDELLKPYERGDDLINLQVESINIMGKAGTLHGGKGDILVPTAHVFEGTADNYPFDNALEVHDFEGNGIAVFTGPMITVLGTSLQNREILHYFAESSWKAIGLEMEGAHYQKAIQGAARIRNSIRRDVTLRYAYYASDNPLISGQTLASGSLGVDGVKPTYLITLKILQQILDVHRPASIAAS